jgi:hypothetical protein
VKRLKPRVTFLLLALLVLQPSWLLGLLAIAEGSHHVSLLSSRGGGLDLVLHHHEAEPEGNAFGADDHQHDDHVVRGESDEALATRLAHAGMSMLQAHTSFATPEIVYAGVAAPRARISQSGPAPPSRTIVLII